MIDLEKKIERRCERKGWAYHEVDSTEGSFCVVEDANGKVVLRVRRHTGQHQTSRLAVLAALEALA